MLKVNIQSSPPAVILACSGRLVMGVEAETLRCIAGSRSERNIVLDMRTVQTIDAAGLGLLVELHLSARRRRASLSIANPSERVSALIALTKLERVLRLCPGTPIAGGRQVEECRTMTA